MIIFAEDTEEVRQAKRRLNEEEMANDHYLGALLLPTGVPIGCKVEQPKDQLEHISPPSFIQGDTQYTNGEVRNRYLNGKNRFEYALGFAGRARMQAEMNTGETVPDGRWGNIS